MGVKNVKAVFLMEYVGAVGDWALALNGSASGWPLLIVFIILLFATLHWIYKSKRDEEKLLTFDLLVVVVVLAFFGFYTLVSPPINITNFFD